MLLKSKLSRGGIFFIKKNNEDKKAAKPGKYLGNVKK